MVIALNRRFYQGFQIQSSFTWSRANDFGQGSQTFTATNSVLNPFDLAGEYSRSNFDIRDRFALGAFWSPNYYHGGERWLEYVANGFTIAPLITASSGAPFTPTVSGSAPSPRTVNGITYNAPAGASGSLADGGSSRVPFLGANSFQMPRTVNVDLRVAKELKVWESWKLTLSADAFNLFNHVNVTSVSTQMFSISGTDMNYQTSFGTPTASSNILTAQRQIQVGLRLTF